MSQLLRKSGPTSKRSGARIGKPNKPSSKFIIALHGSSVKCTRCLEQVNVYDPSDYHKHPRLGITICKKCQKLLPCGEWKKDTDGADAYCSWCGDGGYVYVCGVCKIHAFCKKCLKRWIGRGYEDIVEQQNWACFICDPSPLRLLREQYQSLIDEVVAVKMCSASRKLSRHAEDQKQHIVFEPVESKTNSKQMDGDVVNKLNTIVNQTISLTQLVQNSLEQRLSELQSISDPNDQNTEKKSSLIADLARRLQQKFAEVKDIFENAEHLVATCLTNVEDSNGASVSTTSAMAKEEMAPAIDEADSETCEDGDFSISAAEIHGRKRRLNDGSKSESKRQHCESGDDGNTPSMSHTSTTTSESDSRKSLCDDGESDCSTSGREDSPINEVDDDIERVSSCGDEDSISNQEGSHGLESKDQTRSPSPDSDQSNALFDKTIDKTTKRKSIEREEGYDPEIEKELQQLQRAANWKLSENKPDQAKCTKYIKSKNAEKILDDGELNADEIPSNSHQEEASFKITSKEFGDMKFENQDEELAGVSDKDNKFFSDSGESVAPAVSTAKEKRKTKLSVDDDANIIVLSSDEEEDVPQRTKREMETDRLLRQRFSENPSKRITRKLALSRKTSTRSRQRYQLSSSSDGESECSVIELEPDIEQIDDSDFEPKSSDSDDDVTFVHSRNAKQEISSQDFSTTSPGKRTQSMRRNIRPIMEGTKETLEAEAAERERIKRLAEKQNKPKFLSLPSAPSTSSDTLPAPIVLDSDASPMVTIHPSLVKELKPHQVKGVKFLYDSTIESAKKIDEPLGGCILAHYMGLGKTFQVIAYLHSVLFHPALKLRTALVVTPLNVLLNWNDEFNKWLRYCPGLEVHVLNNNLRRRILTIKDWMGNGGVLIVSYNVFCSLVQSIDQSGKKMPKVHLSQPEKETLERSLLNPGPDIVVCDEAHILKNDETERYKCLDRIATKRRICLTGTPLQNQLKEYYCMTKFVKPKLLGSKSEFTNKFANPIVNGQHIDSTASDVRIMKHRAHVLHTLLAGTVYRQDYSVLTPMLPPRYEYVLMVRLSKKQAELYQSYLDNVVGSTDIASLQKRKNLFSDFAWLRLVCIHPLALLYHEAEREKKRTRRPKKSETTDSDDDEEGRLCDTTEFAMSDATLNGDQSVASHSQPVDSSTWWKTLITDEHRDDFALSGKIVLLMEIIWRAEIKGDKLVVFSQSLTMLNVIERFLRDFSQFIAAYHLKTKADRSHMAKRNKLHWAWKIEKDYFRLDGSTSADKRNRFIKLFNDKDNPRSRLFLISTTAGGVGTNLVGANRVVLLDVHWNPAIDIQAVFRAYRYGQPKPVYIYRLVAQGTMEDVSYNRQITKLSLSLRVIDEQQIKRHFSTRDLAELYTFDYDPVTNGPRKMKFPTAAVPKDDLLGDLLLEQNPWLITYHEHDSLLQDIKDEQLTEAEKQAAWSDYETERNARSNTGIDILWDPDMQNWLRAGDERISKTIYAGKWSMAKLCQDYIAQRPQVQKDDLVQTVNKSLYEIIKCHMQVQRPAVPSHIQGTNILPSFTLPTPFAQLWNS